MKSTALALFTVLCCASLGPPTLKGTWEFQGGVYNGKSEGPPTDYILQRKYRDTVFDAFLLEKGEKPVKYQSGKYTLSGDSCLETETFNIQSDRLTGKTLHYHYIIRNDSLILNGRLPTGMVVEEYWKKVK